VLDHLPPVCGDGGADLQARQLAHHRACEAVHGVGGHLERQLAAVQHRPLERVRSLLQVRLGALARAQQLLQDLGQDAAGERGLDEDVAGGGARQLRGGQPLLLPLGHERAVAQVVRHHDGRVEGGKVQRRDGLLVEASLGLQHRRPLVGDAAVAVGARHPRQVGDQQAALLRLAQDLGEDLDGLAACEEEGDGDA